jgi:hypothetical protein
VTDEQSNAEDLQELDPRVVEGLAKAMSDYMEHRELFFTPWEELRPRIIQRLQYQYGLTDAYVNRSRHRNYVRKTGYPHVDYAHFEIKGLA